MDWSSRNYRIRAESDGFTIGLQAPHTTGREQIGNAIYTVYTFPMTVAAAKAGTLSWVPLKPDVIRIPTQRGRRGGDVLRSFSTVSTRQFTGSSDPVMVNVKPLPAENVPLPLAAQSEIFP